jgi:hypothetical protein
MKPSRARAAPRLFVPVMDRSSFRITQSAANKSNTMMSVARAFGSKSVTDLSILALYELAAPFNAGRGP